jgi:hypothetical protein
MVTFYRPGTREAREELGAVVWNPQANAPLADFSLAGGKFDTDDPKVINRLRELGYPELKSEEDLPKKPPRIIKGNPADAGKPALKKRKSVKSPDEMDADVSPR